ncbi:MAG: response regulator transcription factor [Synergistaceae bacterium]|jgi:DNA-binding response OmpR family regulator|nr:response regulator transcription factor [Synergistaceae bacterium]
MESSGARETPRKILVIEDEAKIAEALLAYLKSAGYEASAASDGESGLSAFNSLNPDLVILDLMLPKISGEKLCSEIRRVSRVPIIMLTAKTGLDDKVAGFALGADDYVTKPFSPRELLARVGSVLRRSGASPLFSRMSWNGGDLEIDLESREVWKRGHPAALTPNEYKILALLAKHPNRAYTREELIDAALGENFGGFERVIDSHIKNLRGKIEDDTANPLYILTVRGVGYRFGYGGRTETKALR